MKLQHLINPVLVIGIAVVLRLTPHPPNFAPISAMALFGGAYLNKRYAFVIPLIAMFISDAFLGLHNTVPFVYGSFVLSGLIGIWIKNTKTLNNIIIGSVLSSILFYLITNFGVWLVSGMYANTISGLLQSYTLAIPFFRNTLIGDLFYTGIFFGSYELVLYLLKKPAIRESNELAD